MKNVEEKDLYLETKSISVVRDVVNLQFISFFYILKDS